GTLCPRSARCNATIQGYCFAYSSMILPVSSRDPSSTMIHSEGRIVWWITDWSVFVMCRASSRIGETTTYFLVASRGGCRALGAYTFAREVTGAVVDGVEAENLSRLEFSIVRD